MDIVKLLLSHWDCNMIEQTKVVHVFKTAAVSYDCKQ